MSESHTRVRNVSLLVAKFERARLILEHENGMQVTFAPEINFASVSALLKSSFAQLNQKSRGSSLAP
eukprot:4222533-Prymnesium_polylepis.1